MNSLNALQTRTLGVVMAIALGFLPLIVQPLRYEAFESYRASLLAVSLLIAFLALGTRPFLPILRENRMFFLLLGVWIAVLVLSSALSISPTRSFLGDALRRMGLWTWLALIGTLFLGAFLGVRPSWRWLWTVGIIVAVQSISDVLQLVGDERPPGLLGWTTYTGGWLMVAVLWSITGILRDAPPQRWRRGVLWAGVLLMLGALFLIGTRAALLGLGAGVVTLFLVWASTNGVLLRARSLFASTHRAILVGFVGLVLLGGVVGVALVSRSILASNNNSRAFQSSAIARFSLGVDAFRTDVWAVAEGTVTQFLPIIQADGTPDPLASVRFLVGYGLENVTTPYARNPLSASNPYPQQNIDRIHNDIYDSIFMTGWLGVLLRYGVFLAVLWMALRRLGIAHWSIWLFLGMGALVSALLRPYSQYLPLMLVVGVVVGLWVYLLAMAWLRRNTETLPIDWSAWLVIAVWVAHLLELQFGFVTLATTLAVWIAFGTLLHTQPHEETSQSTRPETAVAPFSRDVWLWLALGGAYLIKGYIVQPTEQIEMVALLAVMVLVTLFWGQISWRLLLLTGVLWGVGAFLGTQRGSALIISIFDLLLFGLAWLFLMFWGERPPDVARFVLTPAIILGTVAVALFWGRDLWVDTALSRVMSRNLLISDDAQTVIRWRSWDDTALLRAGNKLLEDGATLRSAERVGVAVGAIEQALALNPYNPYHVSAVGNALFRLSGISADEATALRLVEQAHALMRGATVMASSDPTLWQFYIRTVATVGKDSEEVTALFQEAYTLFPDHRRLQRLEQELRNQNP